MRLLLDTHPLLWWITDSPRLSARARAAITDFNDTVYVSASSAWEIATKYRMGKLPQAEPFVHRFSGSMRKLGFEELPISTTTLSVPGCFPVAINTLLTAF